MEGILLLRGAPTPKASWLQKPAKAQDLPLVYNLGKMKQVSHSESMQPLILPSDKVEIVKARSVKVDDIVVLSKNDRLIAHRVIYIHPNKKFFVTKGDNNFISDGKISPVQILGKVEKIKRGKEYISFSHVYLTQSSIYLSELKKMSSAFKKAKVPYVILKGLPVHLVINNSLPKKLYLDADILIKEGFFNQAIQVLESLKFHMLKGKLLGKELIGASQMDFRKLTEPFPVTIDLHKYPSMGFTKTRILDSISPDSGKLSKYLFKNLRNIKVGSTRFPVLNKKGQLIFLLLHLFHHNFRGIERIRLIYNLIDKGGIDWNEVWKDAKELNINPYLFSSLTFVKKYFPKNTPKFPSYYFFKAFTLFILPFNSHPKKVERAERFILLVLLSPQPLFRKLKVLFQFEVAYFFFKSIKSFFLRSSMKDA